MKNELKEIKVIVRKDFAGLPIPSKILVLDDNEQAQYEVSRIIRRDNEIIDGEATTIYTCLIQYNNKTKACDIRYYHNSKKWYQRGN